MWWLWISVCHECQGITFTSEIPFVQPVGMLWFHSGYGRTSTWETSDTWILLEAWPSRKKNTSVGNLSCFTLANYLHWITNVEVMCGILSGSVRAINKDLSLHVTEVCGQRWAACSGPLLDSDCVDYGWLMGYKKRERKVVSWVLEGAATLGVIKTLV